MAEVDFKKLRQDCEANNMIVPGVDGKPSRCVFSSQIGNDEVTLHPLPSSVVDKKLGSPSLRGGKKKRRKSKKNRKKSTKRKSRRKSKKVKRKSKKAKRKTKKRRRRKRN